MTKKIIIDTDIGVDIDDTIALAMACLSKDVEIKAVTTVYGYVEKKARIARKVADLCGIDVPIAPGESKPRSNVKVPLTDLEDRMLPECPDIEFKSYAPELIVSKIMENKNNIYLACLAPLTNIAKAIEIEPEITSYVKEIYFMGGTSKRKKPSHNIRSDVKSADIVLMSGIPMTLVSTETSKKAYWTPEEQEEIRKLNPPLTDFIYRQGKNWLELAKRDLVYLYDPLTITTAITDEFVKMDNFHVSMTKGGRYAGRTHIRKDNTSHIRFVYDVDVDGFKKYVRNALKPL
ncbi:MAG: nucleoside hydrolase [Candidatus Aenigmatarchaeota archaeon]